MHRKHVICIAFKIVSPNVPAKLTGSCAAHIFNLKIASIFASLLNMAAMLRPKRARVQETAPACSTSNINNAICRRATAADLPSEVLLEIFAYLPTENLVNTVPHVCLRWKSLHGDPSLYRRFSFNDAEPLTHEAVRYLAMAPWLRHLHLTDRCDTNAILQQVRKTNRRLETLIVRDCRGTPARTSVSSVGLLRVFNRCNRLQHVSLKGSYCISKKVYKEIGLRLPLLRSVDFGPCKCFRDEAVLNIAEKCARLEEVRAYTFADKPAWSQLPDEVVSTLATKFRHALTVVKIDFSSCTDASLVALSLCKELAKLNLYRADHVTDDGIQLVGNLPKLVQLAVTRADLVTSPGWIRLFKRPVMLPLQKLNLLMCENVNDRVASVVAKRCRHLRELRLVGSVQVTEPGHLEVLVQLPAHCLYVY